MFTGTTKRSTRPVRKPVAKAVAWRVKVAHLDGEGTRHEVARVVWATSRSQAWLKANDAHREAWGLTPQQATTCGGMAEHRPTLSF